MAQAPEYDLSSIPADEISSNSHLRYVTDAILNERCGVPPELALALLDVDAREGHAWSNIMQGALTRMNSLLIAGTFVGPPTLQALTTAFEDNLPAVNIPPLAHEALSTALDYLPLRSEVPDTTDLVSLSPQLWFAAGLAMTVGRVVPRIVKDAKRYGLTGQIEAAQQRLREDMAAGTMHWDISNETSVAFVGHGDPLAMSLARQTGSRLLQIAYEQPGEGCWTYLNEDVTDVNIITNVYRDACLHKAKSLEIYPIKPNYEFLPGPRHYDISFDRIVHYIHVADRYCIENDAPLKPVIIVGRKSQSRDYTTVQMDRTIDPHIVKLEKRIEVLIEERNELRQQRGEAVSDESNILIIDPTELVMDRIIELAQGRPIQLHGTSESCTAFIYQFTGLLEDREYQPTETEPVRVVYNLNDAPTVTESRAGDIAVIVDPKLRSYLTSPHRINSQRLDNDNVVVVPEEILKVSPALWAA